MPTSTAMRNRRVRCLFRPHLARLRPGPQALAECERRSTHVERATDAATRSGEELAGSRSSLSRGRERRLVSLTRVRAACAVAIRCNRRLTAFGLLVGTPAGCHRLRCRARMNATRRCDPVGISDVDRRAFRSAFPHGLSSGMQGRRQRQCGPLTSQNSPDVRYGPATQAVSATRREGNGDALCTGSARAEAAMRGPPTPLRGCGATAFACQKLAGLPSRSSPEGRAKAGGPDFHQFEPADQLDEAAGCPARGVAPTVR